MREAKRRVECVPPTNRVDFVPPQGKGTMAHAFKLRVHVGKDHLVKLPSEFPEGLVEVVVTPIAEPAADPSDLALWADLSDSEYEAFYETVQQLRAADQVRAADE